MDSFLLLSSSSIALTGKGHCNGMLHPEKTILNFHRGQLNLAQSNLRAAAATPALKLDMLQQAASILPTQFSK